MNLNQLEYFVSAAESLNFTKAAKKCFITQTAMSLQIRALEETVGVTLFVRDKHHVELTNAGKIYLNEARTILEKSREAIRLARKAADGIEGKLSIGFIRGYGQGDLIEIMHRFHSAYPRITLNFVRDNRRGLYDLMEKGECDVVFSIPAYSQENSEIKHQYIKSFPLMAVLYPGHPLAQKDYLTYSDLRQEDFIVMQPAGYSQDEMDESIFVYERGGFWPNIVALEQDPETLLMMVAIGMGISILPEYCIHLYKRNQNLKILPVVKADHSAETLDIEMSWPQKNTNPAVRQLLDSLRA